MSIPAEEPMRHDAARAEEAPPEATVQPTPAADAAGSGAPAPDVVPAEAQTDARAESSAPQTDASAEAQADASAEAQTDASAPEAVPAEAQADAPAEAGAESSAAQAETTEGAEGDRKKKRRRRKRKKKPGAEGEGLEATEGKPAERAHDHRKRPATDRAPFHVGEDVFGIVTNVMDTAVMVDLSGKALGIFDRSEMEPDDLVPQVGDRFLARVHQDGSRGGLVVLTRKPLREEEIKPAVLEAAKEGTLVQGLVTGVIKGGVEVDIKGLRAFAPASGIDLHPQNANLEALIGQVLDFKVSQCDAAGRDVVVTRRPMLEAEAHERRKKALTLLEEGQTVSVVVRTIVEWGMFVALPDAQNLEGLIHISEATHDPRASLADLFKPGARLDAKILKIDEKGKIWLSAKALIPDPWNDARQAHPAGSRFVGKVTRVEKFGAFIQVAPEVEGLVHVSDLSFKRVESPEEIVKPGDDLEVIVHHFDLRNRKIALHPVPQGALAEEAPQKVQRNAVVKAEVIRGESAGLQVRVLGVTGRFARGFVPAGHTGTPRGTDLRKKFPAGTRIEGKVLEVDPRRGEPRLSIRLGEEEEERRAHREYRKQVARESNFGTLGDLLARKLK
jgi:small subunit ribosomal protein S1